jgi:ribosomal protein S18 acetylase RimI-like enzyme
MKFMILNNKELSKFCSDNPTFAKEYSYEFTKSLPDLVQKIMDPEIKSKEDEIFSGMMLKSINKQGLIDPHVYYRMLHDVASNYGLKAIFTILLFTDEYDFVGSGNLGYSLDNVTVTLTDFFIVKKYRRKKYGKLLLTIIIKKLRTYPNIRKILLEVDPTNRPAYNLYVQMKFIPITAFNSDKIRMEYWIQ